MIRILLVLSVLTSALFSVNVSAATATCNGTVRGVKLFFMARGSLMNRSNGTGLVKVNGRTVAVFDGEQAKVSYLRKSFTIRNDRGDIVEGKLNNMITGASTLTRMVLPGEGIRLSNVPVNCSMN